jgi:orotate phosphoribosyltransferase
MSELSPEYVGLASGMLNQNIVKFGNFTLKSGAKSVA